MMTNRSTLFVHYITVNLRGAWRYNKIPSSRVGVWEPRNHPFQLILWVAFMSCEDCLLIPWLLFIEILRILPSIRTQNLVIIEYHRYLDPLVSRVTKHCELTSSISISFLKERCGNSNWALSLYACTRQCWRSYVFSSSTFISTSLYCLQDTCMCFVVKIDFIMR